MSNVSGRIVLLTLAGLAAGLLTWFLCDLSGLIHLPDTSSFKGHPDAARDQAIVCSFFGAMIGLLLGLADMIASGAQAQWPRITAFGLLIGAVAGFVGISFGTVAFAMFQQGAVTNVFSFLLDTIARALGWAFIGALAGCADGVRKWNGRVIRNGMIGGFIGGLLGGTVFEAAIFIFVGVPRPAVISRMLGFLITGGLIGLFIGLVQQLLKEAWVRIVVGKNEGREVLIENEQTTIGRSELSNIGLFGDMSVAKEHALLIALPTGGYAIRDVSGQAGTVSVNDKRIQRGEDTLIKNGDTIKVGAKTLIFYERWTKERTAPAPKDGQRRPATAPNLANLPANYGGQPTVSQNSFPSQTMGGANGIGMNGTATVAVPFSAATIAGPGAPVRLLAIDGPHAGQAFAVRSGAIIGRDPAVDVALPGDTSASRRHARIVQEALSLAVEDLGSTNGTFVNGQRITRQALVPGDTVIIGGTSLRLE